MYKNALHYPFIFFFAVSYLQSTPITETSETLLSSHSSTTLSQSEQLDESEELTNLKYQNVNNSSNSFSSNLNSFLSWKTLKSLFFGYLLLFAPLSTHAATNCDNKMIFRNSCKYSFNDDLLSIKINTNCEYIGAKMTFRATYKNDKNRFVSEDVSQYFLLKDSKTTKTSIYRLYNVSKNKTKEWSDITYNAELKYLDKGSGVSYLVDTQIPCKAFSKKEEL